MQVDTLSQLYCPEAPGDTNHKSVDFQIWEEKEEGIISKAIKDTLPTLLLVSTP